MRVLGLDTAVGACSTAICVDGQIVASYFKHLASGHSELIFLALENIFYQSEMKIQDIDLICVCVGPGAFTGMRVGIATARGLALACQTPIGGVLTTEAIVNGIPKAAFNRGPVLVGIDSRRRDFFVQVFGKNREALSQPSAVAPENLNIWLETIVKVKSIQLAGSIKSEMQSCLTRYGWSTSIFKGSDFPKASDIAMFAYSQNLLRRPFLEAKPFYLRDPDAVLPVNGGKLRN